VWLHNLQKSAIIIKQIIFSQNNQHGYHKRQTLLLIPDMMKSKNVHPKEITGWKMLYLVREVKNSLRNQRQILRY
jgi:hypothetical protein